MLVLISTLLIQAVASLSSVAMPVLVAGTSDTLGVGPAGLGRYMMCLYAGAIGSSVMAGALITRYGPIRASQGALMLCGLGLAVCAIGPDWLLPGALLLGCGYGPITPASSALLARSTPAARRNLVFSIKQTGVPLGGAMAGLLVPALLHAGPWRFVLGVLVASNVLCVLAAEPIRRDLDRGAGELPLARTDLWTPVRLVWRAPELRLLALGSLCFSAIQLCVTTYLTIFLVNDHGMDLAAAGACLALAQAGGVGGRIVWGWLSDRWLGAVRMLLALAVIVIVCCVLLGLVGGADGSTMRRLLPIVCVVLGMSAIGWNGVYLAEVAARCAPGQAGMATAGALAFTFVGVMVGATLFGHAAQHWIGFTWSFVALSLPAMVIAGLMTALLRRRGADRA